MTNIRDAWQSDMQAHADATRFTATVTAFTPGSGQVSFKRYPDASAETQPKLASYTSPQVGDVVMVEALGTGWVVVGLLTPVYAPMAVVTALPTASATYRGVALRVAGGSGVADSAWICEKNAAGSYAWQPLDTPATPTPQQTFIGSDVSISSFTNITSLTLGPGTWLLIGTIVFNASGTSTFFGWIGTSSGSVTGLLAQAYASVPSSGNGCLPIHCIVTPTTTTTYYLNASYSSATAKATGGQGSGGNLTNLLAVPA